MSELPVKIRSRGFWRFAIRPATFDPERVPYDELEDVIRRAAVRLRGWDFPHFDKNGLIYGGDYIGSETDWAHHVEAWRFFQSGQFVHLSGMQLDWADQSWLTRGEPTGQDRRRLGVIESLWTITEAFELAARLAPTAAGDDEVVVHVELGGLKDRELFVDEPRRAPLYDEPRARVESFEKDFNLGRDRLMADPDDAALTAATEVFMRFGWRPDREVLRGAQAELRRL